MTRLINLEIYAFILVFLRLGAAFMVMPGFMSSYVNTRVRLCIALAVTFVATPLIADKFPCRPDKPMRLSVFAFLKSPTAFFWVLSCR